MTYTLRSEIASYIEEYTLSFLATPYLINDANAFLLSGGILDATDQEVLEGYLLNQVRSHPNVTSIFFGNTSGGLVDAGREGAAGELYVIGTDGFASGPFRKYSVDDMGRRESLLVTVPNFDARTRSWYIDALAAGGQVWSAPYLLYTEQDMSISLNVAVLGEADTLLGVLSCSIFLSHLDNFLKDLEMSGSGTRFIMDRSGDIIASSSGDAFFSSEAPDGTLERPSAFSSDDPILSSAAGFLQESIGDLSELREAYWGEFRTDDGRQYLVAQPISDAYDLDWIIVVVIPESDFLPPMDKGARAMLIPTIIIMGLAAFSSIFIAGMIARPIIRLHGSTRSLADGEQTPPCQDSSIREINDLTGSFNDMVSRLKQSMGTLVDEISERGMAEEALRRSEERLELALRGTRAGTWDWNIPDGSIEVNPRWAEILGYSLEELLPVTPDTWKRLVHPDDMAESDRLLERHFAGEIDFYESQFRMRHKSGTWRWVIDRGRITERDAGGLPLRMVGTHVDITEQMEGIQARIELEDRIREKQKLESIGRLAGGVSHDLNNLLTPILGYGELLEESLGSDDPRRNYALEIVRASSRAQELVSRLLAFSRRQPLLFKSTDLNEVVMSFENLLRRTIRENIQIRLLPSASPVWVLGDAGQLEQVLMNLTLNAQDAMPEGGELTIRTGVSDQMCELVQQKQNQTTPVRYGFMEVSDTGVGMDPETIGKVFEPFFSTKGKLGTGLGLASVHGIVHQHDGDVLIDSELESGTNVTVCIPLIEEPGGAIQPSKPEEMDRRGSETILLVEDEEQVRCLTAVVLERLGYKVISSASGEEALESVDWSFTKIQLLLTDVMLTGMNGRDLYDSIQEISPGTRALFMSGYADQVIKHEGCDGEGIAFIQKPFTISDITAKVREVLDGS